jgi:hypothetical protein
MKSFTKLLLFAAAQLFVSAAYAQVETPTMGWSSWNTFGVKISEDIIVGQANAMVNQGLAAVGYKYINIDDGFQGGRDENGKLLPHPQRFPNGLKPVVDKIHALGLKAGIYSEGGAATCGSMYSNDVLGANAGFYGHDQQDADLYFKENEFDFIKVDYCGGQKLGLNEKERYTAIAEAIKNTGRDVRYNLCRWAFPGTWAHDIATSWRTTGDIYDAWESVRDIIAENLYLSAYCYGGCYNDMDMLEVGRSLSEEEDKTHFGMWCIMSSPLLIGCNMATLKERPLQLLKNKDLIALNQDPLGLQAYVVQHQGDTYALVKDLLELNGKTRAVALYNPSDRDVHMAISFDELDLGGTVKVRDLFEQKDLGEMKDGLAVLVPAHGTRIYKLEAEQRLERYIYEAETAYLTSYQELYNNESAETAIYSEGDNASGGMYVGWIGKRADNDMIWRNVYSAEGGDYVLKFRCRTGENRPFTVQVNDVDVQTVNANSGSWSDFADFDVTAHLNKGANVIRLYNGESWMPDIDCMELHRASGDDVAARRLAAVRAQLAATAASYTLTPAFQTAIADLITESKKEGMTEKELSEMTAKLRAMIKTIADVDALCREYELIKSNIMQNILMSKESDALLLLAQSVYASDEAMKSAGTIDMVTAAVQGLKDALGTYFRAEDAEPKEGLTFDMSYLLNNPDFTVVGGWEGNPTYRSNCGEKFNTTFNVYQIIPSLKPGIYLVKVNALYRLTNNDAGVSYKNGTETIPAQFYVNDTEKPVASLYSYDWAEAGNYGTVDNLNGYANSMYAAGLCFEKGAYENRITYTLNETGDLKIGLRCYQYNPYNWCCFDNFSITYKPLPVADGIDSVKQTENRTSNLYDLEGRMVTDSHKGIVIREGNKYVNK